MVITTLMVTLKPKTLAGTARMDAQSSFLSVILGVAMMIDVLMKNVDMAMNIPL